MFILQLYMISSFDIILLFKPISYPVQLAIFDFSTSIVIIIDIIKRIPGIDNIIKSLYFLFTRNFIKKILYRHIKNTEGNQGRLVMKL